MRWVSESPGKLYHSGHFLLSLLFVTAVKYICCYTQTNSLLSMSSPQLHLFGKPAIPPQVDFLSACTN